jgi:16S rRNA (adenine1518-N6/adenine1519-N6)-dimethyltransferase
MFLSPREYFKLQGTQPRKRFGQHFLTQPRTAERIVQSAAIEDTDVVVEVGPGLGALTQFILPKARSVHLVELDRDLAGYLEASIPASNAHAQVIRMDVLEFDFRALSRSQGQRLIVMGNLPYNISSPLVFHLLDSFPAVKKAVFMMQKEVGERLLAGPGGKEYGVLSVLLGAYARLTGLFTVGPAQFYPPPKVDSLVALIEFADSEPAGGPPFDFLRKVVSVAFQQRRKTLHNSLKALFGNDPGRLEEAFAKSSIDPRRRPETLSPAEFLRLAKELETALS